MKTGRSIKDNDRLELAGTWIAEHSWLKLVGHLEHPILAAIVGSVLDKVVGPDMTRAAGGRTKSLLWVCGFFISPACFAAFS